MSAPEHHVESEHRVTVLELFFDLVFVFAITQVTSFLAHDLSAAGLGRGMLLVAALWWAWVAYAWLTNTLGGSATAARVTVLVAMAAMLVASLAVPEAFGDHAIHFAVSYAVVRVLHVLLYYLATRGQPGIGGAVIRLAPPLLVGSALLVCAAFASGPARLALWCVGLTIDYAGPALAGARGWRVHATHFVERHGLIIIIALGEAIVSIGVGAAGLDLETDVLAAALLAMIVAGALWWAYFDSVSLAAEHRLARAEGDAQAALARDAYSYLHMPMVAGIILVALGLKKSLAHPGDPLAAVPSLALYGGAALYFAAHVAFRRRILGTWSRTRALAVLVLSTAALVGPRLPALGSLALVGGLCVGLAVWETAVYRRWLATRGERRSRRPA
ncbi:MAG TPA: low temperature requirement protein A [Kofleriaceae bacterium]|nr:low temperature requirement protein A [Kofleriaceae bacterium]